MILKGKSLFFEKIENVHIIILSSFKGGKYGFVFPVIPMIIVYRLFIYAKARLQMNKSLTIQKKSLLEKAFWYLIKYLLGGAFFVIIF